MSEAKKSTEAVKKMIIEKIKFQWGTIKKAFRDLHKEPNDINEALGPKFMSKMGGISKEEFKFYLDHWSIKMADDQF